LQGIINKRWPNNQDYNFWNCNEYDIVNEKYQDNKIAQGGGRKTKGGMKVTLHKKELNFPPF